MWSTILSLVLKFVDTTYFKILWIVSLCFCACSLTYLYQSHKYEAQIAQIKSESLAIVAQMEKDNAQRMAKAIEERDLANSRLSALTDSNTALLDRLHKQSSGSSSTAKSTSAKESASEELARCNRLLLLGAELAQRGCESFGKCAADKDALVEIVK